jgi:hypothetical protein
MYIPKNNITITTQHQDTTILNVSANLNIYNNYVDNYIYSRAKMPLYYHNFEDNKKQQSTSKYNNIDTNTADYIKDYLYSLMNVHKEQNNTSVTTRGATTAEQELQDVYSKYSKYMNDFEVYLLFYYNKFINIFILGMTN